MDDRTDFLERLDILLMGLRQATIIALGVLEEYMIWRGVLKERSIKPKRLR